MFFRHRRQAEVTIRHATKRALCAALLSALGATQASAQTPVSQRLLELDDDERNTSFTLMLLDSGRRCDDVVRTLFKGHRPGRGRVGGVVQRPKRLLHQCAYRTGRDHHHVLELPRVVSNEQDAVAQVWQQEQGRWLQDQVARDGPRDEPNRTCHSAYQSGARLCDWHVFSSGGAWKCCRDCLRISPLFEHRARLCAQRYRQASSEPFRPLGKKSFANR